VVFYHGRGMAHGTADELKARVGGERIELTVTSPDAIGRAREVLARFSGGEDQVKQRSRTLSAPLHGGAPVFRELLGAIEAAGVAVYDIGMRRPTLDDVFLALTGHLAQPSDDAEAEEVAP